MRQRNHQYPVRTGKRLTAENGNISLKALQTITSNPETTGASGGYAVSGAAALAFVDITGTVKAESYAIVIAKNGSFDLLAQLILNAKTKASGTAAAVGGGTEEQLQSLTWNRRFCQQYAEEPLPQRS